MSPEQARLIADFLIGDLEHEVSTTARVIAAVPTDRLDYAPDPKSMNALALVRHLVEADAWFVNSIADGAFAQGEPKPEDSRVSSPAHAEEKYKADMAAAIARLRAMSNDQLAAELDFFGMMKKPAAAMLPLVIKHSVHHRGQLSTYIRPMGGKVPGIYGPSGDSQ